MAVLTVAALAGCGHDVRSSCDEEAELVEAFYTAGRISRSEAYEHLGVLAATCKGVYPPLTR